MQTLPHRVIVYSWCIIVHALCTRLLLLHGRVIMHSLLCLDICECDWNVLMLGLSNRVGITSWSFIVCSLCPRNGVAWLME